MHTNPSSARRRSSQALRVVATMIMSLMIIGVGSVTTVRSASAATVAPINWSACDPGLLGSVPVNERVLYSCATYAVPVDWNRPAGPNLDLALLKRAAARPDVRIGTLFMNPGGPGGSGLTLPTRLTRYLNAEVADRFDSIGFDPRGVGASTPLRCFTTNEQADAVFRRATAVPLTTEQIDDTLASARDYASACRTNAGSLLQHMSTKNVVRDLERLRLALGEPQLNFLGFSYGTLIGSTYAAMYPRTARAIILDGNVDPALRTSDGNAYDRQRTVGFEIALAAFLRRCDQAGSACAFSDGDPRQKFAVVRDWLRTGPKELSDGTPYSISDFTGWMAGSLYSPSSFDGVATSLQYLYEEATSTIMLTQRTARRNPLITGSTRPLDLEPDAPYTSDDSYYAVNCSDKPFGAPQAGVASRARQWERESPTFGRYFAFGDPAVCPVWTVRNADVYAGPWVAKTANPVLVIGNAFDPATQYLFSVRMAQQLRNARLLSVNAFGHCILGRSATVQAAAADYLINLSVPPANQVYQPDSQPFAG